AENEAYGLEFGTMADRIDALHDAVRAVHARNIPVWIGGRAEQVRELVPLADGWNAWGCDVESFAREASLVVDVAPDAVLTWGGLVVTGHDDVAAEAKARSRTSGALALVGGPSELARQLHHYVGAGARWVIAGPVDSSNPENASILGEAAEMLRERASGE